MIAARVAWVEDPGGWALDLPFHSSWTTIPLHRGREASADSLLDGVRQVLLWSRAMGLRAVDVEPRIPIVVSRTEIGVVDLAAGTAWFVADARAQLDACTDAIARAGFAADDE